MLVSMDSVYKDQTLEYMVGDVSLILLKGKFKANTGKRKILPSKKEHIKTSRRWLPLKERLLRELKTTDRYILML